MPRRAIRRYQEVIENTRKTIEQVLPKRERQTFVKWLTKKPITFRTSDGTKTIVLRQAFANIYAGQPTQARALVLVFVNGKIMPFYKSSGESSGRPGEWFPAIPLIFSPEHPTDIAVTGWLLKYPGHPKERDTEPTFAPWVNEIRNRIAEAEKKREIQFQRKWDATTYYLIKSILLKKIPFTDKPTK